MSAPATPPATAPATKKKPSKTLIYLGAGCGCLVLFGLALAVVGVPALLQYIKLTKSAEATANLAALSALVSEECRAGTEFGALAPAGPVPPLPSHARQPANFAADPVFSQLGFAPSPVLYRYSIRPTPTGIELVAEGDLDDDGAYSTFVVPCVTAGCRCQSTPITTNELE